jgi:hypothetical protein
MAGDAEPDVTLDGTVERVVFHAADTNFTVARLVTAGHEQVTIVGALFDLQEGAPLHLSGKWIVDKKFGRQFKVTQQRGTFVESTLAPLVSATVHPSSILRAPDDDSRREEMRAFVADLRRIAKNLSTVRPE